jgi:hypothetical protein
LKKSDLLGQIQASFPAAQVLGCSTAGEICDTRVTDESMVVTAVEFSHTQLRGERVRLDQVENSHQAGTRLAEVLPRALPSLCHNGEDRLTHLMILSDGLKVNGSELVRGLSAHLPSEVTVTGGLAGDGARFEETLVLWNGEAQKNVVVALGLYGSRLRVGFGSLGGWDPFGPVRLITRSRGNVLYELDGRSALALYKQYLGPHARELPASGLLFPLCLHTKTGETGVVRTILSVNENEQSMTFAGDLPEGAYARFMKANFDRLIDGAVGAARTSREAMRNTAAELAILISCVGRKLVLKQRIEEEVEGVRDVLGPQPILTGFYSYGEISPFAPGATCELHNQTMTVTTLAEF